MLERKLHIIHRGTNAFVDIAVTEDGLPVASDGVVRCDLTFERPGSASVSFTSDDNPTWFDLQFMTTVNGRDMNVIRVNLGNVPDPPAAGRWECRVTIFDAVASFDCGVFDVEFASQLGNAAPGQAGGGGGGGGGMGDSRFALTNHSLRSELTDEIVGPGAIGAPLGAFIFFMHAVGGPPDRGQLRLYVGQTNAVANGVLTELEVDGGSVLGSATPGLTLPAVSNTVAGLGWSSSTFEGVIVDVPLEWSTGNPNVPGTSEFQIAVTLMSGFVPSVESNAGINGTYFNPGTTNIGFRVVSSAGVWVFRVQLRDAVTLEVYAIGTFTIDLSTIFI